MTQNAKPAGECRNCSHCEAHAATIEQNQNSHPAPEAQVSAEFKRPDDTEGGTCD